MGTWRSISVQIGPRHFVRADFERSGREVQEFRVILHTMVGPQDWLGRYETHGGTAHRHFRWCPGHHDRLHAWPKEHAAIQGHQ